MLSAVLKRYSMNLTLNDIQRLEKLQEGSELPVDDLQELIQLAKKYLLLINQPTYIPVECSTCKSAGKLILGSKNSN